MKKFLAIGLLALSTTAFAHGYGHGYWRPAPSGGWHWVAPALIGGVIGYEMARPPIYNPPVVVQQPPVVVVQQPQQLPPAPIGYHYETILDANCNCYRTVLVQ